MTRSFGSFLRPAALMLAAGALLAGPTWHGPAGHGGFRPGFHGGGIVRGARPVWQGPTVHGGGFAPRPAIHGDLGPRPGFRGDAGPRTWHGAALPPRGGWSGWVGAPVRVLPRGYVTYSWGGAPWYCHGGLWYRPWRGAYVGCYPPVGLWLDALPFGYASLWFGGVHYYTYENVYYLESTRGGYTVADPPREAAPAPGPDGAALDALLITPREGQSPERTRADRRDAQRYAIQRSGYDPAYSDPSDPGTPRARRAYLRNLRDYLEARGYSVE